MALADQTYFSIASSITADSTNVNAVDINSPLILTDWLKYFGQYSVNILDNYNKYLLSWFQAKNVNKQSQSAYTTNLYIDLFKSIVVNYSTAEDKRFLQNVDYTDIKQVLAVLPFFVKKIKQICLYYTWLRENAKVSVVRNNLRGSELSVEKVIYNDLISSLYDTQIQNLLKQYNVNLESVKKNITIELESLYDTSNYYDVSSNEYDPAIFYNFDNAISNKINTYPTFINELSGFFSITLDANSVDLSLLKDKDFINTFDNLDVANLNLNTIASFVPGYIGTDFYYLSTDSTGTAYTSGILFESTNKAQNILNKRYPTVASTPLSSNLLSKRNIGGFFTPEKQGVINFYSFAINYKTNNLKPSTVYVFPDPNKYGNITNLTQVSYDSPFIFSDDISIAKVSNTNTAQWGAVKSDPLLKTFYPYSSRSENLQTDLPNLERYTDPEDFFTGSQDSIWGNSDVFTITQQGTYPIDSRYYNLLVDNAQTMVQYKTDIYGNQFGLFKKIKQQISPSDVLAQVPKNTCLHIDGGSFTPLTYTTVLLTSDTTLASAFITTSPTYYIVSPLFTGSNFCDSAVNINITPYVGGNFIISPEYPITYWTGGIFTGGTGTQSLVSGPFTVNGVDTASVGTVNSLTNYTVLPADQTTQTTVASVVDTSPTTSIYDERENTYGNIVVRLNSSSLVTPLSVCFAPIINNINALVALEIATKLKKFDIVYNTFIFETQNYTGFIPFIFNYTTQQFNLNANAIQYISNTNTFEKISSPWYNETANNIITIQLKSTIDTNNHQLIYPEIYKYDNKQLTVLYPAPSSTNAQLSAFSLYNTTNYNIEFVSVDTPILTFNNKLNQYLVTFIARDSSNLFYVFNYIFKCNSSVYGMNVNFYKPQGFCHSETFINDTFTNIASSFLFASTSNNITLTGGVAVLS